MRGTVAGREHVLLGFDGLICAVFDRRGARAAADRLRLLTGSHLPPRVAASGNPFDVLRFAQQHGRTMESIVGLELRRCEIAAAVHAIPALGVVATLHRLRITGHTLSIVSNTCEEAVGVVLVRHCLAGYVEEVIARNTGESTPLKPDPFLVRQAVTSLGTTPDRCVMICATLADVRAANAAGTAVIGYAATPGKAALFRRHSVHSVANTMLDLAEVVSGNAG